MKRIAAVAVLALAMGMPGTAEESASEALARGLDAETAGRDPAAAIEIYRGIVEKHRAEEELAARAQVRMAECYGKLGRKKEEVEAWKAVHRDFPGQTAACERATEALRRHGEGAQARPDPATELDTKLKSKVIDVDFQEAPLSDVIDFISQFSGFTIVVDPECAEAMSTPQTLVARKLPVGQVLRLALAGPELALVNMRGVAVITTRTREKELPAWTAFTVDPLRRQEDLDLLERLEGIRISLNFTDTPASEAFQFVIAVSEVPMSVDENCEGALVTLRVDDLTLREALECLALVGDLKYKVAGGGLHVAPRE